MEETDQLDTDTKTVGLDRDKQRVFRSISRLKPSDPDLVKKVAKNLKLSSDFVRSCAEEYNSNNARPGNPMDLSKIVAEVDVNAIIRDKVETVLEKWPESVWSDEDFKTLVCNVATTKWRNFSEDPQWRDYRVKAKKYNLWAAKNTAAKLRQVFGKV